MKAHWSTHSTGIKVRNTRTRRKCRNNGLSVCGRRTAEYGTAVRQREFAAVGFFHCVSGGGRVLQRDGIANVEVLLPPTVPVKLVGRRTFDCPSHRLSSLILRIDVIEDVRILPFQLRDRSLQ